MQAITSVVHGGRDEPPTSETAWGHERIEDREGFGKVLVPDGTD